MSEPDTTTRILEVAMRQALGTCAVLLLVALPLTAADPTDDLCARVVVSGVGGSAGEFGADSALHSARQIIDLELAVSLQGKLDGEHVLELEVYTPHRNLYQVLTAPVTTAEGRSGRMVPVDGYPKRLLEQALAPMPAAHSGEEEWLGVAVLRLPVAGTLIVQSSLYGTWEVKVKVDGQPMTCSRRYLFELGQ